MRLWGRGDVREPSSVMSCTASDGRSQTMIGKEKAGFPFNALSPSADRFMSWEPRSGQVRWPKTVPL